MTTIRSEFLFHLHVLVEPMPIGLCPAGLRITYVARTGRFEGPQLSGRLLAAGDWVVIDREGVAAIDVRATLQTDEGELIHMAHTGILVAPPDLMDRLGGGDTVSADEMYFRTTHRFETASPRLGWLNTTLAIGTNALAAGAVDYDLHRIL